jgi:hypothetical protein
MVDGMTVYETQQLVDEEATIASRWTLIDLLGDDNDELNCTPSLPDPHTNNFSGMYPSNLCSTKFNESILLDIQI